MKPVHPEKDKRDECSNDETKVDHRVYMTFESNILAGYRALYLLVASANHLC